MRGNGADQQRGHLLLIAGDSAVRRRTVQVEPSANLAALSVVPVPTLLNSSVPSDTTYLDGARDQNALLVRLRTAAATPGPLLIYLSGRLTADRRGQHLYLALPGTTTSSTRYTALPWEWLGTELRGRSADLTTVMFDLAADKGAWPLLQEYGTLPAATSAEVYGVVSPPGFPGSEGASPYTRHWIEQLRGNPDRPTNARLHALTVGLAATVLPPGTLILPSAPQLAAPPAAARPPMTNLQRLLTGDTSLLQLPGRRRQDKPSQAAPGLDERPAPVEQRPPSPSSSSAGRTQTPTPSPPAGPALLPMPEQPQPQAPVPPSHAPMQPRPGSPAPTHDERGRWVLPRQHRRAEHAEQLTPAPHPDTDPPQTSPAPQQPVQQTPAPAAPQQDPRPRIRALAEAGQYRDAAHLAQAHEHYALQTYGPDSPQATQWAEIRADLAKMEGNWLLATQLWIAAGRTRLAHQPPDAPEVHATATSAHYCWTNIKDTGQARECGPDLISLLRALPTLDRRHLSMAQQRLEFLTNAPSR
ncbi:hypothetical protein AB0E27_41420 [Streptomyces sparsogenes]|uniref:hypothetical protein n=1 Tax=Streptomyces sparsogenes TaxID=67365 RepID=UPI0033D1C2FB